MLGKRWVRHLLQLTAFGTFQFRASAKVQHLVGTNGAFWIPVRGLKTHPFFFGFAPYFEPNFQPEFSDMSGSFAYGGLLSVPASWQVLNFQGMMVAVSHHFQPSQERFFEKPNHRFHCLFPQIRNNHWGPIQFQLTPQVTWDFKKEVDVLARLSLPLRQLSNLFKVPLHNAFFGVWGSVQKGVALEGKQKLWKNLYFKVNGQVPAWWKAKEKGQAEREFCFFWGVHWQGHQAEEILGLLQDTMALNWGPFFESTISYPEFMDEVDEAARISPAPDFEALKHNLEEQLSKISSAWNTESSGEIQTLDKVSPELLMPPDLFEANKEYRDELQKIINALCEILTQKLNLLKKGPQIAIEHDVINKQQFQEIQRLTQIQYDSTRKKEKREKFRYEQHALQNLQNNLNKAHQELAPKFLDLCCDLSNFYFGQKFPSSEELLKIEADFEKIRSELREISQDLRLLENQLKRREGNRSSELTTQRLELLQKYLQGNLRFVTTLSERVIYAFNLLKLMECGQTTSEIFFKTTKDLHQYWADYASKWRKKATNILERLSLYSGSGRFKEWQQLDSQKFPGFLWISDEIKQYEEENYVSSFSFFKNYNIKLLEYSFIKRFLTLSELIQQELEYLEVRYRPEAFSEIIKSVSAQDPEGWTKYKDLLKNKTFLTPIQELKEFIHQQLKNNKRCNHASPFAYMGPLTSREVLEEDDFRIKWSKFYNITPKKNPFRENICNNNQ